jgi:adenylate cyclase
VAYDEALAHLERGLALLGEVPASQARLTLELALWTAIVNPALLREGWHSPTFTQALERLSDLTQHPELQDDPQRLTALTVLALLIIWSADPARGRRVGEQLLDLAQAGNSQSLLLAHWVLGHSHWLGGQLGAARTHLVQALTLHDPGAGRSLIPLLGADPTVMGRAMLGMALWFAGYPDQGRAGFREALAQAEASQPPSSAAFAHLFSGIAHLLLDRDVATALRHAQALRPLSRAGLEYGVWAELLTWQAGAAAADPAPERPPEQTAVDTADVQAGWRSIGPGVGHAGHLLVQAQTYARAGQTELALEATAQALAWIERTGVRVLEAEVWRVRGELLLMADDGRQTVDGGRSLAGTSRAPLPAEVCFRRALAVAREQEARWLELQAAVSLARLWQVKGRRNEASVLVANIYDWFSEGFDTLGLAEARALLQQGA